MGRVIKQQQDTETPSSAPRYLYLKCKGYYDAALGHNTGCGRLYTPESEFYLQGKCPQCGESLALVSQETPAPFRYHIGISGRGVKIHGVDCAKCKDAIHCDVCFGGSNKPEQCRVCVCKNCCQDIKAFTETLVDRAREDGLETAMREYWKATA